MEGYIRHKDLIEGFGISNQVIKKGTYRNRQGTIKSWEHCKDENDRRCVWIRISTIPKTTRKKYNIPDNFIGASQEPKYIIECREDLQYSIDEAYHRFMPEYVCIFSKDRNKARFHAKRHSLWNEICIIFEHEGGRKGLVKDLYKAYSSLDFDIRHSHYSHFSKFCKKVRDSYHENGTIASLMTHGMIGVQNRKKTNDFHTAIALYYLSQPQRFAYRLVTKMVNHFAESEGFNAITESWTKKLMANNANKTLVSKGRYGKRYFNDKVNSYLPRRATPFPNACWMIDGTPLQFWLRDENGRTRRAYIFVVVDVCSLAVVGFSIGFSEDRHAIMEALRLAVEFTGCLPSEIVSDHFSARKTTELKTLITGMEEMGVKWRFAKVGNAQDKGNVERFFRTFQSLICAEYPDYLGEGITSRNINGRRDAEYIQKVYEVHFPTFDELRSRAVEMIMAYNDFNDGGRTSPMAKYKDFPSPYTIKLEKVRAARLFWEETEITVKRSMIEFAIDKVKYRYDIFENYQRQKLHSLKVRVRYNPLDLSRIFLYDLKTDAEICECRQKITTAQTAVEMTETDKENIIKHSSKNKSYSQFIDDGLHEELEKGMNVIGANAGDFQPLDPVVLRKENQNSKESMEMMNLYKASHGLVEVEIKSILKNKSRTKNSMDKNKKGGVPKFTSKVLPE